MCGWHGFVAMASASADPSRLISSSVVEIPAAGASSSSVPEASWYCAVDMLSSSTAAPAGSPSVGPVHVDDPVPGGGQHEDSSDSDGLSSTESYSPTADFASRIAWEWDFGNRLLAYYHELQLCLHNRRLGRPPPTVITALLAREPLSR